MAGSRWSLLSRGPKIELTGINRQGPSRGFAMPSQGIAKPEVFKRCVFSKTSKGNMASDIKKSSEYFLPSNLYLEWQGCELEDFVPAARQRLVMQAHEAAVVAGHFYTNDVKGFAADFLAVSQDLRLLNKHKVHGGDVGYDIYYAGKAVNAAKHWKAISEVNQALQPKVGMPLGTLRISFKRTTNGVITKINGHALVIIGKRGHEVCTFACDVLQLQNASVNAFDKGWRQSPLVKTA
ncbi:hypothetical protein [Polaromonas naphthalenivorans]|nr:hypothetical protein [Polaromonas naphthalenivorans]